MNDSTGQAEVTEVAAHLRLAVARTARRLRQEATKPGGETLLTPTLTSALATVERCGPLTPSELARLERVKRPTATRMLARLEDADLVERTPDPDDGRSALVNITAEGRDRLHRVRSRKNAYLARRLKQMPAEDVVALERAAEILEAMIDAEREST